MSKLINIEKFKGQENFDRGNRTYSVPSGSKQEAVEQHINNAAAFSKALGDDISFKDEERGVSLSICPTCKEKEIFAEYQRLNKPDGMGHSASVTSAINIRKI